MNKAYWKPKLNQDYFYISATGNIMLAIWDDNFDDQDCFNCGNCFKNESEAQKELDRRLAEKQLISFCDWKNGSYWAITYDEFEERFGTRCFDVFLTPYRFETKDSALWAIQKLGEKKLKLILGIGD